MDAFSNGPQPAADTQVETQSDPSRKGAGSFCLPTATIDALIDGKASAAEIACCLTLAAFTDSTGTYSTASTNAVFKRTRFGWYKIKRKLIVGLCERRASGLPLLSPRDRFITDSGQALPDGPVERAKINYIFETFGQPVDERVWFAMALVEGYGKFELPLQALVDAGDVATRLLLLLYRLHDLEEWVGVPPSSTIHCEFHPVTPTADVGNGYGLIRFQEQRCNPAMTMVNRVTDASKRPHERWADFQAALKSLIALGFVYQSIVVVNRAPIREAGEEPGSDVYHLPKDARPMYVLATRNLFGFKPQGEEGVSCETAQLAGDLRKPVSKLGGFFNGTYAAFSPPGLSLGMTGIYRLRFRVVNAKNALVKDAWARLYEGEREALAHLQAVRKINGLTQTPRPAAAQ